MYKLIIIDDEEKIASGMAQLFPWQNIGFEVVQVFTMREIFEAQYELTLTEKSRYATAPKPAPTRRPGKPPPRKSPMSITFSM